MSRFGPVPPPIQPKPTPLDRVGIRCLLLYLEKKARDIWRRKLEENLDTIATECLLDDLLLEMVLGRAIVDWELALDHTGCILAIQQRQDGHWVEMELSCTLNTLECTTSTEITTQHGRTFPA